MRWNVMGKKILLDREAIGYMKLFTSFTGASVRDCVVMDDDRIIFIIRRSDLGAAIGRGGANIKRIKEKLQRDVDIIAYSDKVQQFIKNILLPAKVQEVELQDRDKRKVAVVYVEPQDKGLAIGKHGRNIRKTKVLVQRHFGLDDVVISSH